MLTPRAIYERFYYEWRSSTFARLPKIHRFNAINSIVPVSPNDKILEVGYGAGADYIQFLPESVDAWGVDINPLPLAQDRPSFHAMTGDACNLPFEDKSFDIAVSIGVFEHVAPIENLCKAVSEIVRVGKKFCIVVPSLATPFEPHATQLLWPVRRAGRRRHMPYPVMFFSDNTWLEFAALKNAKTKRVWYIPGVIQNLCIYG